MGFSCWAICVATSNLGRGDGFARQLQIGRDKPGFWPPRSLAQTLLQMDLLDRGIQ
jgi:hypothetical protein